MEIGNIKENAIAMQKKIIAELRENFGCESSREEAVEKLNQIVDDYEKDNNIIDEKNIHLYYVLMSKRELNNTSNILDGVFKLRLDKIKRKLNINSALTDDFFEYEMNKHNQVTMTLFQIKDILKPIDEYVKEIKDCNVYKQYRFNNLVEAYDLSISQLKQLEHELFADDSTYVSNIDNLIYSTLDKIADDFKMNVIDYIEDNYLQEETGLNCISDIEVIIKDGEYQGLFKEFESYGLNDFSVQNITMFIDRYKEIKESEKAENSLTKDTSLDEAKQLIEELNSPAATLQPK